MIKVEVNAELVPIESVTPYHANIKKHPQSQIDKLASMIAEYGWDQPIVVDGKGVIIKGHGRHLAAQKLGLTEIPVVKRTDLTPAQVKAARIADNKIAESEWDLDNLKLEIAELDGMEFDLSLIGFDTPELSFLEDSENVVTDPSKEWDGMPEFNQDDQTAYFSLKINFASDNDVKKFSELVGQTITDKTRSIWYPEAEIGRYADKRYVHDE